MSGEKSRYFDSGKKPRNQHSQVKQRNYKPHIKKIGNTRLRRISGKR